NEPRLGRYVTALAAGASPARELEPLPTAAQARERLMLGLRLDEPVHIDGLRSAVDPEALARPELRGDALTLTARGRFLGGAVTAELLAYDSDEADEASSGAGGPCRAAGAAPAAVT